MPDKLITADRVAVLYARALPSSSTAVFAAFIFAYIFRSQIDSSLLITWLVFMSLSSLVRVWILLDYKKNKQDSFNHQTYENRYAYATSLTGIGWAVFIALGLQLPVFEYHVYSILLLVAIISISVPVFSSSIKTIYFYVIPPLIVSVPLLLLGSGDDKALGIALIVYALMVISTGRNIYKTLTDSFLLRHEAQQQAESMAQLQREKSATEQRMQSIMNYSPAVIYAKDTEGRYIFINQKWAQLFDLKKEGVMGKTDVEIFPEGVAESLVQNDKAVLESGDAIEFEETTLHEGGDHTYVTVKFPLFDEASEIYGVAGISTDITERQQIEESLHHSQKMDAIGKLTGGIAHDFNNLLSVILGYSELIKNYNNSDDVIYKYSNEIIHAGERAKKLTSNLLEFSRKRPSFAETVQLNSLLNDMRHMLEKTLTARIQLVFNLQNDLWPLWLDKSRLEDAILNLCINSMHAMPDGGVLTLSTSNVNMPINISEDKNNPHKRPDSGVSLSIADTGKGMSDDIQKKIFEPFFTTKGTAGTGLGLSQVYGFVQQSDGDINVYSKPGQGCKIDIYFPCSESAISIKTREINSAAEQTSSGREAILVVDDEVALLALAEETLRSNGYTVYCAENAEKALKILSTEAIDLLFSDVIMPGMDGYQLATEVEKRYPHIKIQMASGYSEECKSNLENKALHEQRLQKPYSGKDLLKRLRKRLDDSALS